MMVSAYCPRRCYALAVASAALILTLDRVNGEIPPLIRLTSVAVMLVAWKQAESANRTKDHLLAVLSHELRTPLSPVLITTQAMLNDPGTGAEIRPRLEMIRRNVEIEVRLIDDLLDVMRISRGRMPYRFEVASLHALIDQTLDICSHEIKAKGLQLVVDLSATEHFVNVDAVRLRQVFWNLVRNAIKFTPEGGCISVRTRNEDGRLIAEVADTGIGIEPYRLKRIFHAFDHDGASSAHRFGGLGLGLAISRSMIEAHGGRLTATSDGKDRGATFLVDFSTTSAPVAEELAPPPDDHPGPRSLRVLLVEDDVLIASLMSEVLHQVGFTVTTANSLAGALQAPIDEVDIVVSDIGLPDGSGLELMRRIKGRRDVPGIALTGHATEDDVLRSHQAGFVAHLTKPIDIPKLVALIEQVASLPEVGKEPHRVCRGVVP